MRPVPKGYSALQIGLHWLIALLVIFQIVFGESMEHWADSLHEGEAVSPSDVLLGTAHYWVGISTFVLVVIRLILRLRVGVPEHAGPPSAANRIASIMHWAFYVLLLLMPIQGLLAYYIGDPFGPVHALFGKPILAVLILLHAAAALYNQFVRKDGTLMRMLVPNRS